MNNLEIERKFLVTGPFKDKAYDATRIQQGYIASGRGRTVRVRVRGDKGYLTIKGPSDRAGLARFEWEKEITVGDANELMRICEPGIIDKTRYLVKSPDGRHVWEVDEFLGENKGLVVAEIELKSEDQAFEKPDWIGEEVTLDKRYTNSNLALKPYSSWQ